MLKKYILIGILTITVALTISAFTWPSINRSNELLVGQSKGVNIAAKGERDSISPCLSPEPITFSPYLAVVGQYVDDHYPIQSSPYSVGTAAFAPCLSPYPITFSPYLAVAGQYIDDHYPVLSSQYLAVVGAYVDDHYPVPASSGLLVLGSYHDR